MSDESRIAALERQVADLITQTAGGVGANSLGGVQEVRQVQTGAPATITVAFNATPGEQGGYGWQKNLLDTNVPGVVDDTIPETGFNAYTCDNNVTLPVGQKGWLEVDRAAGGYEFIPNYCINYTIFDGNITDEATRGDGYNYPGLPGGPSAVIPLLFDGLPYPGGVYVVTVSMLAVGSVTLDYSNPAYPAGQGPPPIVVWLETYSPRDGVWTPYMGSRVSFAPYEFLANGNGGSGPRVNKSVTITVADCAGWCVRTNWGVVPGGEFGSWDSFVLTNGEIDSSEPGAFSTAAYIGPWCGQWVCGTTTTTSSTSTSSTSSTSTSSTSSTTSTTFTPLTYCCCVVSGVQSCYATPTIHFLFCVDLCVAVGGEPISGPYTNALECLASCGITIFSTTSTSSTFTTSTTSSTTFTSSTTAIVGPPIVGPPPP